MPVDPKKVQWLFLQAMQEQDDCARMALLEREAADDPGLRERVAALLRAHDDSGPFLERPPLRGLEPAALLGHLTSGAPGGAARPSMAAGTVVAGRYRLLERIGEGGMGEVWMAEQREPLRRSVAVKLIKAGMDSRSVLARFDAERQALAMMDHPNIARVLDAGTTQERHPFFVMELVKGIPLMEYCDGRKASIPQRLALFVQICQAVQHAHQKGIIHRDLKPSNILVTEMDGHPVPKVIDFGLAKALQGTHTLTDQTLHTAFGAVAGTPLYMAPEQVGINSLDVDTRTDVYALGVILYELLTGTTPLESRHLREIPWEEIGRRIREVDAPRPSTRLSGSNALARIAADRQTEPARLGRLVRGELDWIVLKALEKDRSRRYQTANALSRDIERFLHDEPVEACPPSPAYRLRKLVRRNRRTVVAAALVAASLVTALVGLTVSNLKIASERNAKVEALSLAHQQQRVAEENALKAETQRVIAVGHETTARQQAHLARRRFYAAQMNLANRAWEEGELARALELLESQRPGAGEEDLRSFEWLYLWNLVQRHHRWTARGHLAATHSVNVSPDGRLAVSGSEDEAAAVWDLHTGRELVRFHSAGGAVKPVLFSPDSRRLAAGSWRGLIEVWNLSTQRRELLLKHTRPIKSLAFSNDGRCLASCDDAGVAVLWDTDTGKQRLALPGHPRPAPLMRYAADLRFTADGSTIAAAFFLPTRSTLAFWELRGPESSQRALWEVPGVVKTLAISPDMKSVAMDIWNGVQVRDIETGNLKSQTLDQKGHVLALAFSPDGRAVVSGGAGKTVRVLDLVSGPASPATRPARSETRPDEPAEPRLPAMGSRAVGAHLAPLSAIAVSPDGKTVVSADNDGVVSAWDLTAPDKARMVLPKHEPPLRSLLFTPDGRTLVATSGGGTRLWETASPRELAGFPEAVGRAVLSPDARTLISANEEGGGLLKMVDVTTGKLLFSTPAHTKAVYGLAISPDGRLLASGAIDDPVVKFWKVAGGLTPAGEVSLKGRANSIGSLAWSPDGRSVAVGTNRRELAILDVAGRSLRLSIALNFDFTWTWSVAFSPDGKLLAAGGASGVVTLWDTSSGLLHTSLRGHTAPIHAIAFSPDGQTIATGSEDRTVRVWDAAVGQERVAFHSHPASVTALVFSPDGQSLAAGSADGTVELWRGTPPGDPYVTSPRRPDAYDPENPAPLIAAAERLLKAGRTDEAEAAYRRALAALDRLAGLGDPAALRHRQTWAATIVNLHEMLASQGRTEDAGQLIESAGDRARALNVLFPARSIPCPAEVYSVAVAAGLSSPKSSDGQTSAGSVEPRILSSGADHLVRWWDAATGQELRRFLGHVDSPREAGRIREAILSPDQRQVLSAGPDGTARLWDTASGRQLQRLELAGDVRSAAFSPDGRFALCACAGPTAGDRSFVQVYDLSTGQKGRRFEVHAGPINRVSCSPDGRLILTASDDQTARVYELTGGQEQTILSGHLGPVTSAVFLPDGQHALTGSLDRTLRLWDLRTGRELRQLRGHLAGVEHVAVSHDGRLALSAGRDRMARLWDLDRGVGLALLAGHTASVTCVAFSPDGRLGLSASLDATIRVWNLP